MLYAIPNIPVYAIAVDCNGNTIERGDFDSDGIDEVMINGIVYEDGANITLDGITYTIVILGMSFASNGNDLIVGTEGDDGSVIVPIRGKGGDDFIVGLGGDDYLDGGFIFGTNGDDTIYGDDDIICGNDVLIGEKISGYFGSDTIFGGSDKIFGGDGDDTIYGDDMNGSFGDDTAYGGDDIIDARDDVTNNDTIDGDKITAESLTLGIDVCASDPDNEINCDYDDISSLATFNALNNVINQGDSVDLLFTTNLNVVVTNLYVQTPSGVICNYDTLPITLNGDMIFTYPDDFNGCDTNEAGLYQAVLETEVGDPIVTIFNTSFNVLNESIVGAVGMIGVSIVVLMLYRRKSINI